MCFIIYLLLSLIPCYYIIITYFYLFINFVVLIFNSVITLPMEKEMFVFVYSIN